MSLVCSWCCSCIMLKVYCEWWSAAPKNAANQSDMPPLTIQIMFVVMSPSRGSPPLFQMCVFMCSRLLPSKHTLFLVCFSLLILQFLKNEIVVKPKSVWHLILHSPPHRFNIYWHVHCCESFHCHLLCSRLDHVNDDNEEGCTLLSCLSSQRWFEAS